MAYSTKTNITDIYGMNNVDKWADLDNTEDSAAIASRIANAIVWADNEIDSKLRRSVYKVPFTTIPYDIIHVSATLAGVWLYENRGVNDFDPETGKTVHRLAYQRERAYRTLREIVVGQRYLSVDPEVESYPQGAEDAND